MPSSLAKGADPLCYSSVAARADRQPWLAKMAYRPIAAWRIYLQKSTMPAWFNLNFQTFEVCHYGLHTQHYYIQWESELA